MSDTNTDRNWQYNDFVNGATEALDVCFGNDAAKAGWQLTKKALAEWKGTLAWFFQCHYNDLYRLVYEFTDGITWHEMGVLFVLTVNGHGDSFLDQIRYPLESRNKTKRICNRLHRACSQYREISLFHKAGKWCEFEWELLPEGEYRRTGVIPR